MAGINFINEEEYSKPFTFKNNDVIHVVGVPKGTLCECKGSGGIRMDGTCGRCTKPLEIHIKMKNKILKPFIQEGSMSQIVDKDDCLKAMNIYLDEFAKFFNKISGRLLTPS